MNNLVPQILGALALTNDVATADLPRSRRSKRITRGAFGGAGHRGHNKHKARLSHGSGWIEHVLRANRAANRSGVPADARATHKAQYSDRIHYRYSDGHQERK